MNTLNQQSLPIRMPPLTRTMQVHKVLDAGGQAALKGALWQLTDADGNEVPARQTAIKTAVKGRA